MKATPRPEVAGKVENEKQTPASLVSDFAWVRAFIYWLAKRKNAADMGSCRGIDKPKEDGTTREATSPEKVKAVIAKLFRHLEQLQKAHEG